MILQVINATKEFSGESLFSNVNIDIKNNEKVAIIGRNGCGKTTLLKAICGLEQLDKGEIVKPSYISIGYLSQKAFDDESLTVQQAFDQMYQAILNVKEEMDQVAKLLETDYSQQLLDRYATLQQNFELHDGYNYNQQQLMLFTKFGFKMEDLDREIATFSGGQKTKLAFVKLLLIKPDVLLLDEPTNHLDMTTIEWLEDYLKRYPKAIILVSHDRMFLDKIVSEVYEFEFGQVCHYVGNYSQFVELKAKNNERKMIAYQNQQNEIKRLETLIEKFRYKKNKAAFAQSKIKYLEKMEKIEKPNADARKIKIKLTKDVRGGDRVLTVDELTVGYDKPLCSISFQLNRKDRLAVIGPNGLGKSTFMKTIMGLVPQLGGDYLLGHQIQVAYFDQQLAQVNTNKTVLDELWDMYPSYEHTEIRKVLGSFLFTADDVYKTCDVLSGGEKVRLSLCKIMLAHANLLLLDEPTNHLDIAGKEALEQALSEFDGTIIFVSHDRYFVSKIATCILTINGQDTKYYPLTYQEYAEKQSGKQLATKTVAPQVKEAKQERQDNKKAMMLEKQITKAEEELAKLRELRFDEEYYHDYQKMNQLNEQIDDKHNEIDNLIKQWEQYVS